LQPLEFGETIALDIDSIAAAYVCDGHTLAIEAPEDMELRGWRELSNERFHRSNIEADRRLREQDAEPSPESSALPGAKK
jgi:hypothetical protein